MRSILILAAQVHFSDFPSDDDSEMKFIEAHPKAQSKIFQGCYNVPSVRSRYGHYKVLT